MTIINPRLTFSCPENWDKMKIGLVSRYCESCKRDVQDFTKLTKEEILHFLLTNRNNKVCGRIYKSQLDYHHLELLVTIDSYIQKNKDSNLSFYLLAIGTMMLLSCSTKYNQQKNNTTDSLTFALNEQQVDLKANGKLENSICKIDSLLPDDFVLMGELVANDSLDLGQPNGVMILSEVMPEFIGGFDKLVAYINENLKYPEWEKKTGIQGVVYVSFIVDKEGKIVDPKILKSAHGAKNFDNEVIRLINSMPNWKPGQEHGENVAVQFVLPIKFKL